LPALTTQSRTDRGGRARELDLDGPLGRDEHAGGDDIDSAAAQFVDEPRELHVHPDRLGHADPLQHGPQRVDGLAAQLAPRIPEGIGRFQRIAGAQGAHPPAIGLAIGRRAVDQRKRAGGHRHDQRDPRNQASTHQGIRTL